MKPLTSKERVEQARMFRKKSTLELFKNYKVKEYRLPSPVKKPTATRVQFNEPRKSLHKSSKFNSQLSILENSRNLGIDEFELQKRLFN